MAYIYKKIIHGKPYYYLRISKRVKGKVIVKDIAYLGNDIAKIKTKLNLLPNKYKKEIKKTYRNIKKYLESEYSLKKIKKLKLKGGKYMDKDTVEKIEAIKEHYKYFLKVDEKTKNEIYKDFLVDFAFNTTSLEGNTITLSEANRLLKENLAPKNRTLREIYDLQNTEKVFFDILNLKQELNHEFIISIHDSLLQNIDDRKGYRTHDVRVFRARFKSTPAIYVKTDMELSIKWFKKYEKILHPFVLAAIFHQQFEKIHPFADGNGRTGRILLCWMLMRKKYPPVIVRKKTRAQYLDALEDGNKTGLCSMDARFYKKLINYLTTELSESYWNNFLV